MHLFVFPALFSDGKTINSIVPHEDVFSIQKIFHSPTEESEDCLRTGGTSLSTGSTSGGETMLKLTKKSMLVFGCGVITDIHKGDSGGKQNQLNGGAAVQQPQPSQPSNFPQEDNKTPIDLCEWIREQARRERQTTITMNASN